VAVVTAGSQGAARAVSVSGPAAQWATLPPLPAGTALVAPEPGGDLGGGTFTALVVDGKHLVDWQLVPAGVRWVPAGSVSVPIQYGSST
jgi:hypothetical protein